MAETVTILEKKLIRQGQGTERLVTYNITTFQVATGQWLCWFARDGSLVSSHLVGNSSILVTRGRRGCWICSCHTPGCGHMAVAKEKFAQTK